MKAFVQESRRLYVNGPAMLSEILHALRGKRLFFTLAG